MKAKSIELLSMGSLRASFCLMSGRCGWGLRSYPMPVRPRSLQTSRVVPEPHMGSRTVSPWLV